ncbi:LOW QUALITY PROTEIN: hypothetical protein TorRG33x02_292680 [Trema orientale]|uniref:Uncharacterized protein n=1 Tax=Trema orientale TaxID=63057 RepID=A0A2P5C9Z2_TREOI|nr:LOW QUALITY PROTEIN: hypothetical protein TorRG33x02_292680 [Trema orientale]
MGSARYFRKLLQAKLSTNSMFNDCRDRKQTISESRPKSDYTYFIQIYPATTKPLIKLYCFLRNHKKRLGLWQIRYTLLFSSLSFFNSISK